MLRPIVFRTHWLLGITIGFVLSVMGVSGALLSFEDEIVDALSPSTVILFGHGTPLSPDELIRRIREHQPNAAIGQLRLFTDPSRAAQVRLQVSRGDGGNQKGGNDRGVTYVNPDTGALLGTSAGGTFFSFVEELHRFLALPAAPGRKSSALGRWITGCAALSLVFFALSGLYLRWPRKPLNWRSWFVLHTRRTGRNFLREIHAVVGGWVALFYLLVSLTGLTWSFDWYRDTATALLGGEREIKRTLDDEKGVGDGIGVKRQAGLSDKPADEKGRNDIDLEGRSRSDGTYPPPPRPEGGFVPAIPTASLDAVWDNFQTIRTGSFSAAGISMPRGAGPIRIEVPLHGGFHDGIMDRYFYDSTTGRLLRTDLAADRPVGRTITGAMLAFHSGAFMGVPGRVLVMLASLAMPVFLITGLLLYISRRAKRTTSTEATPHGHSWITPPPGDRPSVSGTLVVYATQTGRAHAIAAKAAEAFSAAGQPTQLKRLGQLGLADLRSVRQAVFVVSTYGEGEPPDTARAFSKRLMAHPCALSGLNYAVLALGDREYPDFCAFGRAVDEWLSASGAQRVFNTIEVNAEDSAANTTWQEQLARLGARIDAAPAQTLPFHSWLVLERRLLNPGSLGRPAYLLRLIPRRSLLPPWSAGDIAEIRPRNDPWRVTQYLSARGLNADDKVGTHTLEEHLAASIIPDASFLPMSAEELVSQLRPLPAREYSIASVWMDGALELVVRQIVKPQGLGCASGWLTSHVSLADSIDLRIRRNPGFHRPREGPMILIGNGTGIAGLRAHLRDSHFRGNGGHWLLFGERHRARDAFFRHEIDRWLTRGTLARFDPAWSRDDLNRRYVQHLMRENAKLVQSWISSGASIMVSGSAKGMAPAVDSVLRDILGDTRLDQLAAEGFYRRDVY